jgi:hypothetical protein
MKVKPTLIHPAGMCKAQYDTPPQHAGRKNLGQQLSMLPPLVKIKKTMKLPPELQQDQNLTTMPNTPTYFRFMVSLIHHTASDRHVILYTQRYLQYGDWVKVGSLRFQIALIEPAETNKLQMGDIPIA